jgi:hypothetical protein
VARAEARRLFHGPTEPPSRFAERLYQKALLVSVMERSAPFHPEEVEDEWDRAPLPPRPSTEPSERRSPGGIILP